MDARFKTPMGIALRCASALGFLLSIIFGLVLRPSNVEYDGTSVACGSVMSNNASELTPVGNAECEDAGLSQNRAIMLAGLALGGVSMIALVLLPRVKRCTYCGRELAQNSECSCRQVETKPSRSAH